MEGREEWRRCGKVCEVMKDMSRPEKSRPPDLSPKNKILERDINR